MVITKSQKVFGANSYVCRSYRRKTGRGRGAFFPFLNKGVNFAILQESGKLPHLIERLHSSLVDFDKTRETSFRKDPRVHLYLQLYGPLCLLKFFLCRFPLYMSNEKHQY